MSAPSATLTTASSILKNVYLPAVRNQLNNTAYLLMDMERNRTDFTGLQAVMALKTGRNLSTAGTADAGALPSPGRQSYAQATFPVKFIYSRFSISGPLIASARSSGPGAFVNALQAEIEGTLKDAKDHQNWMMFGDGTGSIGRVTAATTSAATFTIDNARYFVDRVGLTVDLVNSSGTVRYAAATVCGFNIASKTVSVYPNISAAVGDRFIRPNSWTNDINGLNVIVSDDNVTGASAFQDIDRTAAANSYYNAGVLSAAADRELTLDLMQQGFDTAELASGEPPDCMYTTYALRRKYVSLVNAEKRFVNRLKLDGGFTALEYNEQPLLRDKYATPGSMYFLQKKSFIMFELQDWDWMDEDGKMLEKIDGYDAYVATLCAYKEMACQQPNKNTVLKTLSE